MDLKINDVYPTDPSLKYFWARAKAQLPIRDPNELMALLAIHQNTILHTITQTQNIGKKP